VAAAGLVALSASTPIRPPPNVRVTMDATDGYRRLDGSVDPTTTRCGAARWGQNEPAIAVDPRDLRVIVAGANDDCVALSSHHGWVGYYRSTDGGATWRDSLVPGYPGDTSTVHITAPGHGACTDAGDPTVSFDARGALFYGFICLVPGGGGGHEQAAPESASAYVATFDRDGSRYVRTVLLSGGDPDNGVFEDKIDLTVDGTAGPGAGNVYVAWAEFGPRLGSVIKFARSTDRGVTFSSPIAVDAGERGQQFADLAVAPNGDVYVSYRSRDLLVVDRSTDQGRSFAPVDSVVVRPLDSWYFSGSRSERDCGDARDACPGGFTFPRFDTEPAIAVDGSGAHLVWVEVGRGGQGKVVVANSPDGLRWEPEHRAIDQWPWGHQFMPTIASTDGVLAVLFYDSRGDPAYDPNRPPGNTAKGTSSGPAVDVILARSTDGGRTWSESRLTERPMVTGFETADALRVPFIGDYLGLSAVAGRIAVAWTDSRDVRPGIDGRERGSSQDDRDGFDVFAPCDWRPDSLSADTWTTPGEGDPCLQQGGLDLNIYAAVLAARSGGMAEA
jgi:hypothetical protein